MQTQRIVTGGGLVLVLIAVVGLTGCPSGPAPNNQPGPGSGAGDDIDDTLSGQVSTLDGKPIASASVTLSTGQSASTDDNGFYTFDGLTTGDRIVAQFRKKGFATSSKAVTVGTTPGCIFLATAAETVTIDADTGSTQRSDDSVVSLDPGSLVDEDGNPSPATSTSRPPFSTRARTA